MSLRTWINDLERSEKISFVAVIISITSLIVSLGFSWFQSEKSELNVLPAISIYQRYEISTLENIRKESNKYGKLTTIQWKIENTGLGPAFVYYAYLSDGGKKYVMDTSQAWRRLLAQLTEALETNVSPWAFDNDPVSCPYAIKPGAEWSLFSISYLGDFSEKVADSLNIGLELCYCSLHGDCFFSGTNRDMDELCTGKKVDPYELLRDIGCG